MLIVYSFLKRFVSIDFLVKHAAINCGLNCLFIENPLHLLNKPHIKERSSSSSSSCRATSTDIPDSLSLANPPYRPLLLAGLQGYIPYQHRHAVCRFVLVVLHSLVHVKGSTGVHDFSCSVPHGKRINYGIV